MLGFVDFMLLVGSITTAVAVVTPDMLAKVWDRFGHMLCVQRGHIEDLFKFSHAFDNLTQASMSITYSYTKDSLK